MSSPASVLNDKLHIAALACFSDVVYKDYVNMLELCQHVMQDSIPSMLFKGRRKEQHNRTS